MNQNKYNGWTNYETWNVALWMDNEEGSQSYWAEQAQEAYDSAEAGDVLTREQEAASTLAESLQQAHEETLPGLQGFAADLLNAAMSEVNWYEIAEHLISDCEKEEEGDDDESVAGGVR